MKLKDQQKEFESMLDTAQASVEGNVPTAGELPELHAEPAFDIDYDKIQKKCDKQAKIMLKAATGFMIGDDLVKGNAYIHSKLKTDITVLGGMLYQTELLLTMQRALSEEMRHGALAARMWEVFSGLAKTISENNKQLLQTVEAIKLTYLDLKDNIISTQDLQLGINSGIQQTEQGTISLGSRDLINQATERKKLRAKNNIDSNNEDIQDAEEVK